VTRRALAAGLAALVFAAAIVGCSNDTDSHLSERTDKALPGNYGGTGPGVLVSAQPLENVDPQLTARASLSARITYTTALAVNDNPIKASGTVFVPKGKEPQGGWLVVALGHDDDGIHPECAPSGSPSLLGLAPSVRALLGAGYVVTVPDYVGLGLQWQKDAQMNGQFHPFLDSTTAGYNMIDAVRATRKLVSGASNNWIAVGTGQGGQAAWAANELAADYGGELSLQGALALVPTAALEWLADASANGTLTRPQQLLLQQYLAWLPLGYPDFPIDDFRRGAAEQHWDQLSACWGAGARARDGLARALGPHDVGPTTPQATDRLRGFLRKTSLPQGPTAAPMLVTADKPDGLIPPERTASAVDRACAMGDVIDFVTPPPDPDLMAWIADRFNGVQAPNTCSGQAAPTTAAVATPTTSASAAPSTDDATTTADAPTTTETTPGSHTSSATLAPPAAANPPALPAEAAPTNTEPPQ
jgi:dienelactone hydrolase